MALARLMSKPKDRMQNSKVKSQRTKGKKFLFCLLPLYFLLLLGLGGCGDSKASKKPPKPADSPKEKKDKSLTLNEITLEQANAQGQLLWKVRSPEARYNNKDKKVQVEKPTGELFQDGKLLYRIEAKSGEVDQKGQKVLLFGEIVANDVQSGTVLRGGEMEWEPKKDMLIVRKKLKGSHPDLDASAEEARVFSRKKRMELLGQVVGTTKKAQKEEVLQMRTEHLVWEMDKQLVTSDRPVEIERYLCQSPQACPATDLGVAERGEVNLKTKTAELQDNAQLRISSPPLDVKSNLMVWNIDGQTLTADQSVNAIHREQQVTFTGDRGELDLQAKIFYLSGGVTGSGGERQSQVKADEMTWNITTEQIEAQGNVVYSQVNPPFNFTGEKAVGKLKDETLFVSGGVVSEVFPSK